MRGLGVDLVSLPEFAAQVREPGSAFLAGVLTPREARRVRARAAATSGTQPGSARFEEAVARHAGSLWAAKEAFIKAWSCALFGTPPLIGDTDVDWHEIEVIHDEWNRPSIALHGHVAAACEESLGPSSSWRVLVSVSHDGPCAIAQVIIADTPA
ncbi:holo-ACP synthase [Actinomyces sp. ICM47]|uniref:holo-ACP synthase n=1 Tax=Actinomyces sp. ICM47 TaxID=936548 RepID=UPI0025BE64A2|nr:holo-ACP synthase [Actinomyces sp. ICM47]